MSLQPHRGRATVTFTVERKATGPQGRQEVREADEGEQRQARSARCFKPVKGSFTHAGAAARTRFKFSGRVGSKALKPGRYRLVGSAGGAVKRASFKIVK